MSLIRTESLSKRIGGNWALWDVNLEINSGEIMAIFGRSGSGKSVLARVMSGLDEPTSGSVVWNAREAARNISVALDEPAYAPDLTVYENLDMFAALWGVSRKRRAREISFLLELLKLSGLSSAKAANLSMGMLRRLEIARALVPDAPLVVIDSLLDTLDPDVMEKLWDHMLGLRREENKSFLILTSRGKTAEVCGRIAVIHRGRINFVGRPDDFRRLAGEDMVVLGDITNPSVRSRIREQLSVVIKEEDGFLSFRVSNGERVVSDMLSEYGTDMGCVYLKRPTLEDALDVVASGGMNVTADVGEGHAR
ncbi:MAG: ABC transporter ATP-binding protein [Armatimonadota bacterium]|nr:ABC transporter ATP-binding protein [bacterium]